MRGGLATQFDAIREGYSYDKSYAPRVPRSSTWSSRLMHRAFAPRRVADLLVRWPVGLVLVSWRYLWRTTVLHRWEGEGGVADHPPELSSAVADDAIQRVADGVGPLLHRCYRVRIRGSTCSPEELMGTFVRDL